LKLLLNYGLVNREEFRPDFGGGSNDTPDCDSDLEEEISHGSEELSEKAERRKLGVDYNIKDKTDPGLFEEEEIEGGD